MIIDETLALYLKAKYVVTVESHPNGCVISYPQNYFIKPNLPSHKDKYIFIDDKLIWSNSLDDEEKERKVFGYDNRFLVMTDLLLKIERLGISKKLILFFDGLKPKNGLFSILPEPKGELLTKENVIQKNYIDIYERFYYPKDAENAGILEGYNNITNLIAKGEL
jgi:hypothetical protein